MIQIISSDFLSNKFFNFRFLSPSLHWYTINCLMIFLHWKNLYFVLSLRFRVFN